MCYAGLTATAELAGQVCSVVLHEKKENHLSRRHKGTEKKENEIGAVIC